ncbi:hypothetical protein TYRP_017609, partial [Tyrophagus putrescentiae]
SSRAAGLLVGATRCSDGLGTYPFRLYIAGRFTLNSSSFGIFRSRELLIDEGEELESGEVSELGEEITSRDRDTMVISLVGGTSGSVEFVGGITSMAGSVVKSFVAFSSSSAVMGDTVSLAEGDITGERISI